MAVKPSLLWCDPNRLATLIGEGSGLGQDAPRREENRKKIRFKVSAPESSTQVISLSDIYQPQERTVAPSEFEVGDRKTLEERLEGLVDWLLSVAGGTSGFVADEQGLPLANRGATTEQVAMSSPLAQIIKPICKSMQSNFEGSLAVELPDNNFLHLLWSPSPAGRLAVGLILTQALGGERLRSFRLSLDKAIQVTFGGR